MAATGDGSFSVQHSPFDTHSDTLWAETQKIQNYLNDLQQNLQGMMSTWDGTAREAYRIAQTNWNAACDNMRGTLQQAYHASQEIHNQYIKTDNQGASRFGGLR